MTSSICPSLRQTTFALLAAISALGTSAFAQTAWTGSAAQNWSAATWSSSVPTSGSAITLTPTAAATLTIPNGTAAVGSSLDFSSTTFNASLTIAVGGNLTLSGAVTTSGSKVSTITINNTTSGNAATVLSASSIAASSLGLSAGGSAAGHFSFGGNITTTIQALLGVNGSNGSNWTQTGGTTNVGTNSGFGLSIGEGALTAGLTGIATYNLNGGTLAGSRIGVMNANGNNGGSTPRYAMNGVLNFNNGIIQNAGTANLHVANGYANSGSTANTMQFDTSKPLSVVLGGGTAREFQANTGIIILSPSVVLSGTGSFTKTGTGSLMFTGGNTTNAALNAWSGNSSVTSGTIAVNYSQIAGEAATGGTDTLSGAYSPASRLVLNGGNFTIIGRASAAETTATAGAMASAAGSNTQLTLTSTAGLVVGQSVSGTNVAPGTYIRRIISGTVIELSHLTVGGVAILGNTLTFGAASFANTQTINDATLNPTTSTITVTPGAGTSTTLLNFGNVTGTGGLTKAGTGRLQLTGTLDYTGNTTVSAGTLEFAPASGSSTLTGNVLGLAAGTLVKSGDGTTILGAGNTSNSFSGALSVTGGTLQIGNSNVTNSGFGRLPNVSSVSVASGATLTLAASNALANGAPITLNGTLNTVAGNASYTNVLGALTMNGGTLTTNISPGVSFQTYILTGNVTIGGTKASLINASQALNGFNGINLAGAVANVTRIFTVNDATSSSAADLTISVPLLNASSVGFGASNLTKAGLGTMELSANNTYTGNTTVSAGTLALNGSQASALTVEAGASLRFTLNDGLSSIVTSSSSLTLSANSTVNIVGTPDASTTYTLYSASAITGTPVLDAPITGFSLVIEANSLKLKPDSIADTTQPIITLIGDATLTVDAGSTYIDAGATATDESDPLNPTVTTTGTVNTAIPGIYVLSFDAVDTAGNTALTVTRTVTVVDLTAPVITRTGSATVSVDWGSPYTDAGATATDNLDPSVVAITSGTVNTAKPGTYTLTYNASDVASNAATQVTRTVTVTIANPDTVDADGYSPLMRYALGATGPGDSVTAPITSATSNSLSLTAVVRNDDPKLIVVARTNTNLTLPANWTTTGVSGSPAGEGTTGDQTGVTGPRVRKVYTVTTESKTFLRLEATLAP